MKLTSFVIIAPIVVRTVECFVKDYLNFLTGEKYELLS